MSAPGLSVVVPVSKRSDDLGEIMALLHEGLKGCGRDYEVVLVVDGDLQQRLKEAQALAQQDERVRVLSFARMFGEGAALRAGLMASRAPVLMTHPAYFQVQPAVLQELLQRLDDGADVAFASRTSEKDSAFNRLQRWWFNFFLRRALWVRFRDISSGVRALKREALEDVAVHGPFHRFLPVLAAMKGLVVSEVPAAQHPQAGGARVYRPSVYVKRFLDLVNVFFLARFTYKPLRFFGLVGGLLFGIGLLICLYLAGMRLFGGEALADRPLLLLGVLLIAVGFQTLVIGLLGELITFAHAAKHKPYAIREVVRKQPGDAAAGAPESGAPDAASPEGAPRAQR